MWRKISTAISILCVAIYAFAVLLAVYKMVTVAAEHRIIFEQEFAKLQDTARGADVLGFTGTDLENEIRASVLRSLTLDAAIVTLSGGAAFAVEKPGERVVIPNHNNTDYSFNTKGKFYRPPYFAQITTDGRTTLGINVLTGYIDKDRLGDILRETLLIVLLSVTAAFLVLMLDVVVFTKDTAAEHKKKKPESPKPPEEPFEPVFDEEPEVPMEKQAKDSLKPVLGKEGPAEEPIEMPVDEPELPVEKSAEMPAEEPEKPMEEPAEIPMEKPMEELVKKPMEEPAEIPMEKPIEKPAKELVEKPMEEPAEIPMEKPIEKPKEKPTGMYLGLIQKLHKELAFADEKKTDIVLLCAEWTKNGFADADAPLVKQIAEEAAVFFDVDRIAAFKRGETGIFIVLPGVAFKSGLKTAREFHGRILGNTAFKTTITNFFVGLTALAGREVDPDRFILEAEKAVEKAKEDTVQPIVAFKADPSKYKNYLKKG
jgi:hypothetical protein